MSYSGSSTTSFFGWLDYDEREAQRMREMFAALDDKETIDSLGLGTIRDTISELLFPGISTVQTRARYFLFVPWICQVIESERVSPARFDQRLRELEVALIESLRALEGPNQGVIGFRARKRLSRLPSSVYWNGLHVFGLRNLPLSLVEYRSVAGRLATMAASVEVDDDGERAVTPKRMWDSSLQSMRPQGFPFEPISLMLTREESDFLAGKMSVSRPDSMIGQLAADLNVDRSAPLPWEVPLIDPGARLTEALVHARNFSDLMEGAQALYNLLLARRAQDRLGHDRTELVAWLIDELTDWAELIGERSEDLRSWISDGIFWSFLDRHGRVPLPTRRFVMSWANIALQGAKGVVDDAGAASLVIERELRLKGKLARLIEDRALENWNGDPFSPGQLTFRWGNAKRILDDLEFHEESHDARS